jgi:hypothetical protein
MAELLAQRYHNAAGTSSGGWAVTDKIFGYLNSLTFDYARVRAATPGSTGLLPGQPGYVQLLPSDPGYAAQQALLQQYNIGVLGMQRPWGAVILFGGVALIGFVIYKMAK